jgi:SPW repeat-containing protein
MNLRMIPTSVHGVLDYLTGSALLAAPELLRLKDVPSSAFAFRLAGGGAAAYSLLTDYELGARKIVPMPVHLMLDAASGALLAASPWVFGFAKNGTRYWLPQVLVGLFEILAAGTTKTQPSYHEVKPGLVGKVRSLLRV